MLSACGPGGTSATESNLAACETWTAFADMVAEPANEPASPACGHECPGSRWTHIDRWELGVWTTLPDGTKQLVDWKCHPAQPPWKSCYCVDPSGPGLDIGAIMFPVSSDETVCAATRERWIRGCPK